MTGENDEEVKEFSERVEDPPSGDDAENEVEGDQQDSSPAEGSEVTPKEQIVRREPNTQEPAPVAGETPREKALRLEVERLRADNVRARRGEVIEAPTPQKPAPAASTQINEVLSKYKPEELNSLREVLPLLAEEMGFVRKDQLTANNWQDEANNQFEAFMEKHPEMGPENDKDGTLWKAFSAEYNSGLYNKNPTSAKDLGKIFEKAYREVFESKDSGRARETTAAQEKVKVASHAGTSAPTNAPRQQAHTNKSGLRLDMLKGFTDEEKADMVGE